MKWADLVSRSTITHMESCPFCVLGKPTTKSIPISSHFQTGWVGVVTILLTSGVRPWSFDKYHNGRQTVQYPPSFSSTNIFILNPYISWWMLGVWSRLSNGLHP